jgi:hypothetical protein
MPGMLQTKRNESDQSRRKCVAIYLDITFDLY